MKRLTSLIRCLWPGVYRVQREPSLAGDVELANGQSVHLLHSLILVGTPLKLLKTFGNVKSNIDEDTVDLRLDLVRPEEDVGFEVVDRLIDDILLEISARWCRPAALCSQRQECHVGNRLLVILDLRVISL